MTTKSLLQIEERVFLTDGGLETTLVFQEGIELPCFAAYPLLMSEDGRARLQGYFAPYLRLVTERDIGFILDTVTWRANRDWGAKLGHAPETLHAINRDAAAWAVSLRESLGAARSRVLINGVVGPRGDGYRPDARMTAGEAAAYHAPQIAALSETGVDMISATTMNYVEEAIGIVRAAATAGVPVVNSFTVETNGKLPSGETLQSAIARVDRDTDFAATYHMINCAHPTHFDWLLHAGEPWTDRIRGVRANASTKSHAELDEATQLDPGDPLDLGQRYRALRDGMKRLTVLGGCCGTDHRHIRAICDACLPDAAPRAF